MSWYLTKHWEDDTDGIDAVLIHYTTTPRGEGPDWGRDHSWRPLQDHGGFPRRRSKVVSMPNAVWSGYHGGWDEEFLFHYYFEVYAHGGQWTTQTYTDEIVTRRLEFVDDPGWITNLCIYWAVDTWEAPVYSPMEDYRFPADSEFTSIRYYGYQDKPRYHHAKAALLERIERPHCWQGKMWGPVGHTLLQQYHIGRMYPEDQQGEFFYGPDGVSPPGGSCWTHQL